MKIYQTILGIGLYKLLLLNVTLTGSQAHAEPKEPTEPSIMARQSVLLPEGKADFVVRYDEIGSLVLAYEYVPQRGAAMFIVSPETNPAILNLSVAVSQRQLPAVGVLAKYLKNPRLAVSVEFLGAAGPDWKGSEYQWISPQGGVISGKLFLNNLFEFDHVEEGEEVMVQAEFPSPFPEMLWVENAEVSLPEQKPIAPVAVKLKFRYVTPESLPAFALPPLPEPEAKVLAGGEFFNPPLRMTPAMVKQMEDFNRKPPEKPVVSLKADVIESADGPALRLRLLNLQGQFMNAWQSRSDPLHAVELPLKLRVPTGEVRSFDPVTVGPPPEIDRFTKPELARFKPVDIVIPLASRFAIGNIKPGTRMSLTGERRGVGFWFLDHMAAATIPFELEFDWPGAEKPVP